MCALLLVRGVSRDAATFGLLLLCVWCEGGYSVVWCVVVMLLFVDG